MAYVRVRNVGSAPYLLAYNSQVTRLMPGVEAVVEEEAAKIHFGDWDLRNDDRGQWRHLELARLRGIAGSDEEGVSAGQSAALWESRRPRVELLTATGDPIVSVIDDPSGDSLPVNSNRDRDRELVFLRDQIDKLMEERELERAQSTLLDIPVDAPDTAPRRRSRGVEVQQATAELG